MATTLGPQLSSLERHLFQSLDRAPSTLLSSAPWSYYQCRRVRVTSLSCAHLVCRMAFSPFTMGNATAQPRRSHKARYHSARSHDSETTASFTPSWSSTTSSSSSSSSSTSQPSPGVDVFGPTHPLHPLVAAHLPDVLARIVLAYQSPLLPRQHHYHGHIVLPYGAYGFRDQRQLHMSANPLSLAGRSFSWSGWMNRSPVGPRWRNYFLLSFEAHNKPGPSQWLHIGYRQHYDKMIRGVETPEESRAFTVGFNGNDLDARPADTDLMLFGAWEHWSGSYDYPRQLTTPHVPCNNACEEALHPPAGTLFGRRKLYRNGELVVEDDCIPLTADQHSTLVVGNYQHHGHDMTLDGGVCDVRLYSRVLSAAEMRALYSGEEHEVSGECLEAHWPLEGEQHIATKGAKREMLDVSGNERHLELHKMNAADAVLSQYRVDGQ